MGIPGPVVAAVPWLAPLRTESAPLWHRAWLVFLLGGLAVALIGGIVGDEGALRPTQATVGLAASVAILLGIRSHRPARAAPWGWLAACTAVVGVGIVIPTSGAIGIVGQLTIAAGSIAGAIGFALLIRRRIPGGDRAALLDAAILAAGVGIVIWAFGFGPLVIASRQSSVVATAFFYPAILALAMVVRMWFLPGSHRPATRLFVLYVVATNAVIVFDLLRGFVGQAVFAGPYEAAQLASLAFIGAAALHPSMAVGAERKAHDLQPITRRRIVLLAGALLLGPATLISEIVTGRPVDPAPYLIGGMVIGLLVVARLGDALRQLRESLHERDTLMKLLRRQALYDSLTSLPNRTLFTDRLSAAMTDRSSGGALAVLLVDLDDFKSVNDSYGHEVGDGLLVAVGRRLREAIREGDTAARLGGDEFVIALPGCLDRLVPVRVAERVLALLGAPFDIGDHRLTMRASVGVAITDADDVTVDDLIRNADVAMYVAKSRGKGRFEVYDQAMQAAAQTQLQLRSDLAIAIAENQLRLHYQPVVDLRTGRTIGYEALVRWQRDGRLVPPADFIPMAESSGLIGPLTEWVVNEACQTTVDWGRPGHRPWVSVNLPADQLVRKDLVTGLGTTLARTGLAPDRLVIELTESSLLDIDVARPAIERLREMGIRLAIDDFGTGYSALSYLARLPIDIVKIDRSFVIALVEAGPEEAIASAIIALAARLGLTTIGEGIETAEQLDHLVALGCDLGQGFYLGRPDPSEDLRASPVPSDHPLERAVRRPASLRPHRVVTRAALDRHRQTTDGVSPLS